jgi:hypothetical protein
MKAICPLCSARKAKRACPGINGEICAVCCGTKRLTEIACPPDCPYLAIARVHPAAVVQRQQERDLQFLLPRISDLTETQYRLFLFVQALVLQHAKATVPPPLDSDVADAAASVAATLETARKGIIYEHHAASLPAQRLATEMGRAVADLAQRAGANGARLERDAAAALRRLERAAREAEAAVPDEAARDSSWLAMAARLMSGAAAASGPEAKPAAAEEAPRIILP